MLAKALCAALGGALKKLYGNFGIQNSLYHLRGSFKNAFRVAILCEPALHTAF